MFKYALVTVALGGLLLGAPAAAVAGPVEKAAAALRTDSVYLDPGSNRNVELDAVRQAIGSAPIKIAILPRIESVNQVAVLPRTLAASLPGNTIAVISGRYFYAGSEVVCTGSAGQAAATAIKSNEAALDANDSADSPSDLTKPLTDFVTAIKAAPVCPEVAGRGDRYADSPGGGEIAAGPDDTASVLPWVLTGIGAGVVLIGAVVLLTRRRTRVSSVAHRDEATALVQRLADELAELPEGDARNEAAARHGEAEAILLGATTDTQFAAVIAAAQQGLEAARTARSATGERR